MDKFITGLLILFFSLTSIAQEATSKKKLVTHKQLKILTKEQINQLKEGALLIRLQTKRNSVSALRKIGKDKLADKIESRQKDYNLKIITAFKNNFNFCPAYFFFSDYSKNIREKQFDKVVFLNDNLLEDTTIKLNFKNFLTAEFGTIKQDTAKYFSHYSYEPDKNWSLKTEKKYYGGPNFGFGALVIKSDQFIQLRRPFPYYVRTFDSLPIKRKPNNVVTKMNRKLFRFYNKKK